jgi:S-adenosylmethionine hydrolase
VIADIAPEATVVDISHDVPMGNVAAGAFMLLACHQSFPKATVFVAVVDPGVGSERLPVIARTERYTFVGPDNGILSPSLQRAERVSVRTLINPRYRRSQVSDTFHGRDIFAPGAAYAAQGVAFNTFGPVVTDYQTTGIPVPLVEGNRIGGRVLHIDRFGNAITNVPVGSVEETLRGREVVVTVGRRRIPYLSHYSQVRTGRLLALGGSSGFVEISVNRGSAARRLALKVGSGVVVQAG